MRISRQTAHKWCAAIRRQAKAAWARHASRLSDLERRSGRVVRRIETSYPGELVHIIGIKKQAKIRAGGGWKVYGMPKSIRNGAGGQPRLGDAYIHSA